MPEIKTYITYFDDNQIDEYNLKCDDNTTLFKGNDTSYEGESINHLNVFYCELCTMYYIWKNKLTSDYVVLKQYRRPFDWEKIKSMPQKGEVICYKPLEFNIPVIMQFAVYHGKKRANDLLSFVKEYCNGDSDYLRYLQYGMVLYTNNTMVINWNDFCSMCEFVFGVIELFDRKYHLKHEYNKYMINAKKYTEDNRFEYQTHWVAYIGERLVSAYIATKMKPLTINRLDNDGFFAPYKSNN